MFRGSLASSALQHQEGIGSSEARPALQNGRAGIAERPIGALLAPAQLDGFGLFRDHDLRHEVGLFVAAIAEYPGLRATAGTPPIGFTSLYLK